MGIVKHPVREMPNYELKEGASVEEMRAMAVRAMYDEITFEWTPKAYFDFRKTGACAHKHYEFFEGTVYQGLPYSSGGTGLFQWLQYYDKETGVFSVEDDPDFMWKLGNSCAASVNWGLSAVCSSIRGSVSTYGFVYKNNLFPLGDVKYPASIRNFEEMPTDKIIEANGETAVLEGYALTHPGDCVIATDRYETQKTARHAMMVTSDPVVVRNEDGSINAEESYLMEQDQRSKDKLYELDESGYQVSRRGRLDHKCTFKDLLDGDYIAITTLEFQGKKPYEVAKVQWSETPSDLEGLLKTRLCANYRIVTAALTFTDEKGGRIVKKVINNGDDESECGFPFAPLTEDLFKKVNIPEGLESGTKYICDTEVLLANGAIRKPETFEFTA